ncbi:putative transcription factor bHLH family [Helianthus debilis subsp. tardiflorus]
MGTMQRDSVINNVLKNLCSSYGWSYGVFWSFDQQNAIFLTIQDAYFDEEIRGLIESLCPQVHMLGGGLIGQVAFTKNHHWMCLEDQNRRQSSSNAIRDMFLDDSEFNCQFSCGIKTIAAIPVEPQGVVQFGSTNKIIETVEFVTQTKRMFQETMNHGMFEDAYILGGAHISVGPACSSACPVQSCVLSSTSQPVIADHNPSDNWLQPNNASLVSESGGLESWSSFPTQSNGQDLFDSLPEFGISDDFDISQWIPPSPGQSQVPISMNNEENGGNLMPMVDESRLDFHHQKSTKGLLSKLRIDELLEGISGTSHATSSTAKRRKAGNSIWEMSSLRTVLHKPEPGLCMANGYGMNRLSTGSQAKNQVEPPKAVKKKAKPGTRPRPKDRQQILDRMAELRELIPNGNKMSIDSLLDRTVKHMVFLQSVTKHADRIKQADEPKKNKDNNPNSNDATWAYEVGNQTMGCPLIVEDLSTPGQMLIEMLCEDRGFFLEMVDIIKGFGVIILKGVMEIRDKIWARFIVESEAKRHVTRHEIFASLVQFLQATCLDDNHVRNTIMKEKNRVLNGYQQSLVQLPISLPETHYCIGL